jgi:hypothetical protein
MADENTTTNGDAGTSKSKENGHIGNGAGAGFEDVRIEENGKPWLEPETLDPPLAEEEPYPLDALPELVADAVAEYQSFGQQPVSLIAGSGLAVCSLVCQPFADVARDRLLRGPISLNVATIGISGEGKTAVDRHFTRSATDWLHQHRRQSRAGDGEEKAERALSMLYHDTTPERLATALYERWPSAGQFSDEAALVIGSHAVTETAMRHFGLLNRLWDGSPFQRERQTSGDVYLVGRRFTVNLSMQPVVLRDLLLVGDGLARAVGWFGRFLIAWPKSSLGTRVYREPPQTPALDRFNQRIIELLDDQLTDRFPVRRDDPTCALDPPVLTLDRHAKECWRQYYNEIAGKLGEAGRYADIVDVAAKSAENVARLAANHHILAGGEAPGEITEAIMEPAVRAGRWYLNEARRALGIGEIAQVYADAALLGRWASARTVSSFPAREVLRSGPRPLRQIERRDAALALLVETGHLRLLGRAGQVVYVTNPKLLNFWLLH